MSTGRAKKYFDVKDLSMQTVCCAGEVLSGRPLSASVYLACASQAFLFMQLTNILIKCKKKLRLELNLGN